MKSSSSSSSSSSSARAALLTLALLAGATNCPAQPDPQPTTACHEGDACWDCKTDGNKRCGPGDKRNL